MTNTEKEAVRAVMWTKVTDQWPRQDDGDEYGEIEWWCPGHGVWQGSWKYLGQNRPNPPTHWRSIITPDTAGHEMLERLVKR